MNKGRSFAFTVLLVMGQALPVLAESNSPALASEALGVDVRVFNYAGVPRGALASAQGETKRIFTRSEIEIRWLNCAAPNDGKNNLSCRAKTQATDIVVRVVSEDKIVIKHRSQFGVALIPKQNRFGIYLNVFYKRIAEYAERWNESEGLLLGHVIAHEIGHLLLGANSHSQGGIMSGRWTRRHMEQASRAGMSFTDDESARLRDQVALRAGWPSLAAVHTSLRP